MHPYANALHFALAVEGILKVGGRYAEKPDLVVDPDFELLAIIAGKRSHPEPRAARLRRGRHYRFPGLPQRMSRMETTQSRTTAAIEGLGP